MRRQVVIYKLAAAFVSVLAMSGLAEANSSFARLKNSYEAAIRAVCKQSTEEAGRVKRSYPLMLKKAMTTYQQAGDLKGVMAMREEIKRYEKTRSMPTESTGASSEIMKLADGCRKRIEAAEKRKNELILSTTKKYVDRLETDKKRLTKEGKFDEALAIKAEQQRVSTDGTVTAAEFALASNVSERVKEEEKSPPKEISREPGAATSTATSSVPSGSRECSRCLGTGKAHEACKKCAGTGRCTACKGAGTKPSALKGSRTRMKCYPCMGNGKCKGCGGKRLLEAEGTCTYCRGKGHVAIYSSSYHSSGGTSSSGYSVSTQFRMFDQGDVAGVDVNLADVLPYRRDFAGKVCRSLCFVRKTAPGSKYIKLSPDGRLTMVVRCYSSSVTAKALSVIDKVGNGGAAIVTYGVSSSGTMYIFDVDPAPKAAK